MKTGPSLADFIAGQYAASGVLAALYERDGPHGTGRGRHIDIALLDCTIAAQTHSVMTYLATGVVPPRRGTDSHDGPVEGRGGHRPGAVQDLRGLASGGVKEILVHRDPRA